MLHIFAGTHKHQKIISPKGEETRPTSGRVREAVFNICQHYVEGTSFLDLFSGSGAMGLEALSRGAAQATFIDSSKESVRCIQQNLQNMKFADRAKVLQGDVLVLLERLSKQGHRFDIIYADPPWETFKGTTGQKMTYSQHVCKIIDTGHLLAPGGVLFLEESSKVHEVELPLQSLVLVSKRTYGKASLQQYKQS